MGNVTAKTSGDIASFMTPAETNIKSLKVHFSPKQLGEGDPSPENVREIVGWDGVEVNGCGKNIAHIVGYSATTPASSDPSLRKISNNYGTTISTTDFSLPDTKIIVTQSSYTTEYDPVSYRNGYFTVIVDNLDFTKRYNVSFNVDVTSNPLNVDLSRIRTLSPAGTGFEPPAKIDGNRLFFKNVPFTPHSNYPNRKSFEIRNAGMSFTLSEFMVTPVDDEDFEYEPYQGNMYSKEWTKNLLDIWKKPNGYKPSSNTNGNYNWSKEWIVTDELKGKTITYSTFIDNTNASGNGYVHIWTKNSEGNYIKTSIIPPSNKQIIAGESGWSYVNLILTDDIYSVIFGITVSANGIAKYPMVELGSEPTEYQPYVGTVYDGYVDLISGELVEEWKYLNLDNLEWYTTSQVSVFRSGDLTNYYVSNITNFICNKYTTTSRASTSITNMQDLNIKAHDVNDTYIYIKNTNYADVAEFKSNLIDCNMVYLLQKPITHQLTPTQLSSFIGQNNFWSNADYVEIEYELKETEDIQKARKKIILNQPHIESATGDAVSFTTDMKAPLKECKVYFKPVQEGSGDPSPENVRNIIGWDGVEVKNDNNVYSIDWTDDVGTVYGGYVDLVKGELVAEWIERMINSFNWSYNSSGECFRASSADIKRKNVNEISPIQSKIYKTTNVYNSISYWLNVDDFSISEHIGINSQDELINSIHIKDSRYTTVSDFLNGVGNESIIYKLETPIHYQLTPQQLLTLKGINNFSCGIKNDLSIKYWNYKKSNSSNIAYEAKNLTFDGTNYIDTGVYLFSEKNVNRDFEVVIEDLYNGTKSNTNTIVCAKYNSTAIGFLIRLNGDVSTTYKGTIFMRENNHNNITIKRINNIITIEGEIITNPKVKFTNAVHNHPLVLGCALQDNGTPFRYEAGTIGHIIVKWL